MKKLKTTLIHFLGGMTVEESQESDLNSRLIGRTLTLIEIRQTMYDNYGKTADEWCKAIYRHVENAISELESC